MQLFFFFNLQKSPYFYTVTLGVPLKFIYMIFLILQAILHFWQYFSHIFPFPIQILISLFYMESRLFL